MICVHFMTYVFNQVLCCWHDPSVHKIVLLSKFFFQFRIKYKLTILSLFISWNVLNQKSICVEPRKENFSNNIFDSLLFKLKELSSDYWGITQIKSTSIGTIIFCNQHWIWIILFTFRHFFSICCKYNSINNQVFKWSLTFYCCGNHH